MNSQLFVQICGMLMFLDFVESVKLHPKVTKTILVNM